jgi:hypothetical protein
MKNGKMGYPAIRVHCSESAPEDDDGNCKRLRDWLWWKCRKFYRLYSVKFGGKDSSPEWKQLKDEVCAPTYRIENGKIKVEEKDEMKKRGLRSPNIADALNLTFFEDFEMFNVKYNNANSNARRRDAWKEKWKKEKVRSWKTC